ncbi:MAG TPA: hypothetical protein VNJ08_01295 [Bacteriovoracaceae bacterium]|nr:hypothetical protein [Bacteriovoracaceae bacterium]
MARPTSISILNKVFVLCLLCPLLASGADYKCEEVEIVTKTLNQKETAEICFHERSPSFFISNNCLDLSCDFTKKIKTTTFTHSNRFRPGVTMCQDLGGGVDYATLKGKGEIERCVFTKDLSSISLNLLESWNGKIFAGPGKQADHLFKDILESKSMKKAP